MIYSWINICLKDFKRLLKELTKMFNQSSTAARLEIARQGHKLVAEVLKNQRDDRLNKKPIELINKALKDSNTGEGNNDVLAGELCICGRKPKTLLCIRCKMFTYGRIAQKCLEHRNVTFLMDFITCPNCLGPTEFMHGVDIDYNTCLELNSKMKSESERFNVSSNEYY